MRGDQIVSPVFRLLGLDDQYLADLARYHQCRGAQCGGGGGGHQGAGEGVPGGWIYDKWRHGKRSIRQVRDMIRDIIRGSLNYH